MLIVTNGLFELVVRYNFSLRILSISDKVDSTWVTSSGVEDGLSLDVSKSWVKNGQVALLE